MAITPDLLRNHGHPWDKRPGFDMLFVAGDTEAELDEYAKRAKQKFWAVWCGGRDADTGQLLYALYKPCGINEEWDDHLHTPHPGIIRSNVH